MKYTKHTKRFTENPPGKQKCFCPKFCSDRNFVSLVCFVVNTSD